MNKTIIAILLAILIIPFAGAEDIEMRSSMATAAGAVTYTADNFAALWMDLDKNLTSETITINVTGRTIGDGELVYTCVPRTLDYEDPGLAGTYEIIGFLGSKYVVYDQSNELVRLLEKWDTNDKRTIMVGDSYLMPEGYELKIQEIDLDGNKVYLQLLKDGTEIDSEIVQNYDTYVYENVDDVMVFSVCVDSVFRGTESNFCQVKYVYLISENVMKVESDDSFGQLEVTSTSPITLTNDGAITLGAGDEIDLTDDLYIKVADNATILRYYLAKNIEMVICPDCPECPLYPEPEDCPPCPTVTPETITVVNETVKYVNVPVASQKYVPGFEAVFAICGLLAVVWLILRQKQKD